MTNKGRGIGIDRMGDQLVQQRLSVRRNKLRRFRHKGIRKVLLNLFQRRLFRHYVLRQKIQNVIGQMLFDLCEL